MMIRILKKLKQKNVSQNEYISSMIIKSQKKCKSEEHCVYTK